MKDTYMRLKLQIKSKRKRLYRNKNTKYHTKREERKFLISMRAIWELFPLYSAEEKWIQTLWSHKIVKIHILKVNQRQKHQKKTWLCCQKDHERFSVAFLGSWIPCLDPKMNLFTDCSADCMRFLIYYLKCVRIDSK